MEINQELFETGLKVGAIFFIGFIVGMLMECVVEEQDKGRKYDLNNDGKINLTDIVLLRNYIMEEENGKVK